MATSFEEILAIHCLSEEYLTRICSKEHRDEFTKRMKDWKAVGIALGFTQEDLDMIDSAGFPNDEQKRTALLLQWSMREKKNATYLNLAKSLFAGGLVDLLQELCSLVPRATPTIPADQPSSGDVNQGVEPSCPLEEKTGNQVVERLKKGVGALEVYRPESQSVPDTLLESHLKSEPNRANGVKLSEKDLVRLMRLIQSYSYKWNPIGLCLGFTQHELDTIFGMLKLLLGAPVSYLQELLSQWVQWPTEDHQNIPTLGALCTALRSSLVGLGSLAEKVEKEMEQLQCTGVVIMHHYSNQDVGSKIEELEAQFRGLHTCILKELKENKALDIQEVLHALTLLPTRLRNEYQKLILDKLPTLRSEESISELFLHLNPLFSFLDYSLLEYIIEVFGSTSLKDRMKCYSREVRNFMSHTTVQQLIDYWPCEEEIAPNVSKMVATIKRDPQTCNLVELDTIRRNVCIRARLFDVICAVVSVKNSHSFIVIWDVPSILAPDMIKSLELADGDFFSENDIRTLSVGNKLVYSPLTKFRDKVKKRYQIETQTTVSHAEWIASPARKVFRLAMIQRERVQHGQVDDQFVKMTISGKIDDILHRKTPIELKNMFKSNKDGEQQLILIEGAPGSGKTTLTIFICQNWGEGKLFQQFAAVILVQLRDPAVQRAQTIADLLPVENAAIAQEVAAELIATNGRGVLWILDGWDELPPHLQQGSIFCKLLPPKPSEQKLAEIEKDIYSKHVDSRVELWFLYLQNNPMFRTQYYKDRLLNEASVIVTSRPISSGDLHPVVSSRIEVLGFTPEEQRQYFTEYLKGDTKGLGALLEKIQENPVVQSSCYLPLNAALIVHYFKIKGYSLPNTEYEVFSTNILHCIRRHFEREGKHRELPTQLESLDDLSRSEAVREPFECLCELAYHGVMKNKVTFSSSDLPQGSNTLSLLQAIESFLQSGKSVFYNFIHLSFQELLAGYYIATSLSNREQVSQFRKLFHHPRFVGVFQFYAAITKLKMPGIDKIISEIILMQSKRHLLSLLHCLHEAQDPSICQSVVNQLGELDFLDSSLSPMDLLSIGYLIVMSNNKVVRRVDLGFCHIGDHDVKTLMKYLAYKKGAGTWKFDLGGNNICKEGTASIAKVLQSSGIMNSLDLLGNPIGAEGLQSLAEALITNTSLVELNLSRCSFEITDENGPIVTEMLQRNKTLMTLNLMFISIISDGGMVYIAKGLEKNTALKCLKMNGISAAGGKALASSIAINASLPLVELELYGCDMITEHSKQAFIDLLQQNTSIETLKLSSTGVIGDPMSFLAEALRKNSTLRQLNLCHYILTSDMIKDVSRMLAINCSLTSLDISRNPIGDDEIAHLATALKQNKSLKQLDVSSCRITDAGVAQLAKALQVNNSLHQLNVRGNNLTKNGRIKLRRELAVKKIGIFLYL